MIEFRRSLTTSYMFKFFLQVTHDIPEISSWVDQRELSAIAAYDRPISYGEQLFDTNAAYAPPHLFLLFD